MSQTTVTDQASDQISPDQISPEQIHAATDARGWAILDATATLITELGWERFTMRHVADRAGVSLSTIYASWPTKTDLALAAVLQVTQNHDGSFLATAKLLSDRTNLILCLLSIQRSQPAYRTIMRDMFLEPFLGPIRAKILAEATRPMPEQTANLIALVGPAILLTRGIFLDQELSAAELRAVQDLTTVLIDSADPDHDLTFTQSGGSSHREGSSS